MSVNTRTKKLLFLVWVLVVPAGMWYIYNAFPPTFSGQWFDIFAFLFLFSIVGAMPITINGVSVFLIQWVSLAAFLRFGLFAELIFTQVAVMVLLIKLRMHKSELFRVPLNSIMFFIISLVSGVIYYQLGGQTGPDFLTNPNSLWIAALYPIVGYFINQVIFSFYLYVIYKSKESFFGKDFVVETITTIVTLPLGFVLYIMYNQLGLLALFFIGIPFISLSIIFKLYYSSEKVNEYLQKAAEIGHQMAERLQVDDVIDLFIQKITGMLPVDYAYILDVTSGDKLQLIRRIEGGNVTDGTESMPTVKRNEGISGQVWDTGKAAIYTSRKQWSTNTKGYIPDDSESILAVPIVRNKKVIGVLMLASKRKRAYEKSQLMIVDILCSYLAVAIENAKHYELTKIQSERCALTKLYNYRYFENLLNEEFEKLYRFERKELSLIILDIDHFKEVNDTYGHQSGNEILFELATRLTKLVGTCGTVARYGGEEFVVLLPEISKVEAFQMAELIRQTIADTPFTVTESLDHDKTRQQVTITASIGVATAPEDAEDSLALIRHADRALYVGAKRAGRNRVAEYIK
ncbi:sensor domain-containing diguanylate cyclase [Neobacillus sp. FSL H8-0543]|uniref:sensor domain-containing diguanylate cyclase n=1 Tax=Neobacillus sp. FSL H8-0543 TaxID=2954672 RepID=UPI0031594067